MIITLIFAIIFIVSIVALIITINKDGDIPFVLSATANLLSGFCAFVCGLIIAINNAPINHERARIEYEETIAELIATRESINTIENDYSRTIAIKQYNADVRKFKTDIEQTQVALKNPWVSWFNNYAYADFDANVVSYL